MLETIAINLAVLWFLGRPPFSPWAFTFLRRDLPS